MGLKSVKSNTKQKDLYRKFDKINGTHPWSDIENGHVKYQVRELDKGQTIYFNFNLAKEMGLIDKCHPHKMNAKLNKKILSTFNLRIINEYDVENNLFTNEVTKEHAYIASRYLQLQHKDKRGLSSGDGRGLWNGYIKHKGVTWDVSSRGTGVTCLAPGAVKSGRNLQTGTEEFGYGCGLAEIDELIGTAIMSETIHNYGFETERMLAIVDFGDGCGIGVRAGKNLIRPAHLFLHLKQNNLESLKQAVDYYIDRQINNKDWQFGPKENKYSAMLDYICDSFARFSARLEREYLFTWLDWDGDNVLANAGLIDYGSIRWLGLRHDKYRYDDVQRYSTTLNEQKGKAQLTVQVFAQLIDYIKTKKKKPLVDFKSHKIIKQFNDQFDEQIKKHFMYQIGLNSKNIEKLFTRHKKIIDDIYFDFQFFEKLKTEQGVVEVEDGINHPPILNMRYFLLKLPQYLLIENFELDNPKIDSFIYETASEFATEHDIKHLSKYEDRFMNLIRNYSQLMTQFNSKQIDKLIQRSKQINKQERMTGNALIFIVQKIMKLKGHVSHISIQKIIEALITKQMLNLDDETSFNYRLNPKEKQALNSFDNLIQIYKEDL